MLWIRLLFCKDWNLLFPPPQIFDLAIDRIDAIDKIETDESCHKESQESINDRRFLVIREKAPRAKLSPVI